MFKTAIVTGFAGWWLLAVLYNLPLPRLHAWLRRYNRQVRWVVSWSLFCGNDDASDKAFYACDVEFSDEPDTSPATWTSVAPPGHWVWHQALLAPHLAVYSRIEELCTRLHRLSPHAAQPAVRQRIRLIEALLAAHVAREWPTASPERRRFRVVRHSGSRPESTVSWIFATPPPPDDPR